ncbi:GtrA family protein [Candidatus Wolfebacteria bacterium]|nr:GtrA family protein [Candidatus Wolfebacteria bacterium]
MTKRDSLIGILIGLLIGLLILPIIENLQLPVSFNFRLVLIPMFMILTPLGLMIAAFLSRYLAVIYQIAKFGVVGVLNTLMDWGILNALMFLSGIYLGFAYSGFKAVSFVIATINSYLWNKHWTFESGTSRDNEFVKFLAVSVVGAFINIGIASSIVNFITPFGGISLPVWANIGAAMATVVSMVWNFSGYKFFVFSASGGKK